MPAPVTGVSYAEGLSEKAIIGTMFMRLELLSGLTDYVNQVTMHFTSSQAFEKYRWVGMSPRMQLWVGGRKSKGLRTFGIDIYNDKYEATLEVGADDLRRDKTGQLLVRINEMVDGSQDHWHELVTDFLKNATSIVCYDEKYFFATDHEEGKSGVQSNFIDLDISAYPAKIHNTVAAPSPEEMSYAIFNVIKQILSFKDDTGRIINRRAKNFIVIVPLNLMMSASSAINIATFANGGDNLLFKSQFNIQLEVNADLNWGDDQFSVHRTDGNIKSIIRQDEYEVVPSMLGENSENYFKTDTLQFGLKSMRAVGPGLWPACCLGRLV